MTHHNLRKYSRSSVAITAVLMPQEGEEFQVEVVDLSMNGMFVHSDVEPRLRTHYRIDILLGHFKHEIMIQASGRVVRVLEGGFALKFDEVHMDSEVRLQGLILAHSEKPQEAATEFSSGGGWIFTPPE